MFDLWLKSVIRWLAVAGVCLFLFCLYTSLNGASAADVVPTPTVTLQQSFAEIIQSATSGVQAGVAFLKQEVPDVIRQLLVWKAVQAGFWTAFYLLSIIVGFFAVRNGVHAIYEQVRLTNVVKALDAKADALGYRNEGYNEARAAHAVADSEDDAHIPKTIFGVIFGVILGIAGIVSFVKIWTQALTVVQIYIAPKVWLIEYGASLIK